MITFIAVVGLVSNIGISHLLQPDSNFVLRTLDHVTQIDRDEVAALLFGAAAAGPTFLVWLKIGKSVSFAGPSLLLTASGVFGTVIFGGLILGKDLISPYLPHPTSEFKSAGFGRLAPDGFVIEDYKDTNIIPIRLAVSPDGRLFVSGHSGIAAQEGGVVELVEQSDGTVAEKVVARMLNRPYGLVATQDHLFVSRSGQYSKWTDGRLEQVSTGAVTRLTDLDNDGVMDHYHDIVSGLPGAKGPDFLHQNNGIALSENGDLFITTANETDAQPSSDPRAGAILRAFGSDFEQVEVFAYGLRNPFGLAIGPNGKLYATDNDPQSGLLGGNLGDKYLQVNEGDFYGHPYAPDDAPFVTPPLLRSSFALGGIAVTKLTSGFIPDKYNNSVFIVVYGEGRIMQVVELDDGTVSLEPFATVPGAVDLAIAPDGDFFVGVYPDKIVRVRYAGESE